MIRLIPTAGLALALAACATAPMADPQADQEGKRFDAPAPGAGAIYVYRPGLMAFARTVDVGVAGGYHAQLAPDTYFRLEGPPGPIDVMCKTDNTAARRIDVAAGEIRYVEVAMGTSLTGPRCSINEVSPGQGQAAILHARRVVPR